MKLDIEQEEAANYIHGNSIIIAGAGTGKTTTLIGKIKILIEHGIKESEILVISFTNEAVNNFNNKCKYNVDICTFHKIAAILSQNNMDIIDNEMILTDIAEKYLLNLSSNIKRKIYHYYKSHLNIYNEKKYLSMMQSNHYNSIVKDIIRIIKYAKCNKIDIENTPIHHFTNTEKILLYIIYKISEMYNHVLQTNNFCDFDDLIINATASLKQKKTKHNYKYILVDEYQDISLIRLHFLLELVKINASILTVVGDDFQSIYGFSGSNIQLFYEFDKYFENSKRFFINNTYRCPQEIINKAGNFIMKNKYQIKKNLVSVNKKKNVIHKIYYRNKKKVFYKLIEKLLSKNKNILILSRNNYDIYSYLEKHMNFENSILIYKNVKYSNIRFLSIHSSKGLEADITVILNLTNSESGLPSKKKSLLFDKIFFKNNEYKYAEERRLFYVGLTRCKEELYLLIDQNNPSIFAKEI